MKREDTYSIRVSVAGRDLGTWDRMSGGEVDSEETTYKPGGLAAQITLGGSQSVGNVTVSKLYDEAVHGLFHWLASQAGKADMIVTKQPLNADGSAKLIRPIVYTGKLKAVTPPDVDSSSSDAAIASLEMTCNGGVS
jgi:hypothetical protein